MKLLLSFTLLLTLSTCVTKQQRKKNHKLFVLLIDGFRWDYTALQDGELYGFDKLLENGVKAQWVQPIFPTTSHPSWTTLSTGLYAESHNAIGDVSFDAKHQKKGFSLYGSNQTQKSSWWIEVEPIWITAVRLGKKVALFQWFRCDVMINGVMPQKCEDYGGNEGERGFAEIMRKSFAALKAGYDLVMSYIGHVDTMGHAYGPESPECMEAVRDVDAALERFLNKLEKAKLDKDVNIIVLSDHGMKHTGIHSGVKYVPLYQYIRPDDVRRVLHRGGWVIVTPQPGKRETVYKGLKTRMPGVHVYMKNDIPERYHYKNSRRVKDVLLVAHEGYFIDTSLPDEVIGDEVVRVGGAHGYDPDDEDMRSIFFASGPDFKKGEIHPPIHMVDIYQLYTHLLGLSPEPHNGTWETVKELLNVPEPANSTATPSSVLHYLIMALNMLVGLFLL